MASSSKRTGARRIGQSKTPSAAGPRIGLAPLSLTKGPRTQRSSPRARREARPNPRARTSNDARYRMRHGMVLPFVLVPDRVTKSNRPFYGWCLAAAARGTAVRAAVARAVPGHDAAAVVAGGRVRLRPEAHTRGRSRGGVGGGAHGNGGRGRRHAGLMIKRAIREAS